LVIMDDGAPNASLMNTINVQPGNAPSTQTDGRNHWTIGTSYDDAGMLHEGSHVIGNADAYTRVGKGKSIIRPGWEKNIMAEGGKDATLDERNIH